MPALNAPFRETVVCFVVLGLTICHCYASSRGLTAKGPNVPMPDPDNVLGCGPGGGSTCIIGYKGGNPAKRCPTGETCKKCNEGNGVSGQCFCEEGKKRFYQNGVCISCEPPAYMVDENSGMCVCNTEDGFALNANGDACECDSANNFVPDDNGECVCDVGFALNANGDACECDSANNFVPDDNGGCECDVGFALNANGDACECDSANNFVPDDNGGCECEDGYTQVGDTCVLDCTPSMTITPSNSNPAVDEQVTFNIIAECFSTNDTEVTFLISFGDSSSDTMDESPVCANSVCNATANHEHSYAYAAQFAVTASVSDSNGTILSTGTVIVVGSSVVERNFTLSSCGNYVTSVSGGQGGTVDAWDISGIPSGSKIDVYFDTINIPDRLIMLYDDMQQLDTQWVGSKTIYENNPSLYPGPWSQGTPFTQDDIFAKNSMDKFTVLVLAPQQGTAWNYKVRC